MLVNPKAYLIRARREGWAMGGFNVFDLESARAVIDAGEDLAAPLLVQTSEGAVKHAGLENMVAIVRLTPPDIRSSRSRSAGEEDSTLKGGIRSDLLLIASTAPPSPPSRELVCGSVA